MCSWKYLRFSMQHLQKNVRTQFKPPETFKTVHDGFQIFECNICRKILDQKQNLQRHLKTVHEKRRPSNVTFVINRLDRKSTLIFICKQFTILQWAMSAAFVIKCLDGNQIFIPICWLFMETSKNFFAIFVRKVSMSKQT